MISAGYACHLRGGSETPIIKPVYKKRDDISAPIINITSGTVCGYRYLQFGANSPKTVTMIFGDHGDAEVKVRTDACDGKVVASGEISASEKEIKLDLSSGIVGKHAVYFEFTSVDEKKFEFDSFTFD
jgi:hypothetical protein